ncbi:MAG: cytochrome-c peroxidase, partial [Myxococcota bacterium]
GGYGGGGGGFECRGSLVSSAVSAVDASGNVETLEHPNVILPLDLALSPVGTSQNFGLASAAIVSGGATVDDPKDATDTFPAALSAQVAPASVPGQRNFVDPCFSEVGVESRGIQRTTAVAYTPDGYLVRQTQNPHRVIIEDVSTLELPGPSTFDTGHDLFFGDAGGGIACASCHAEGADDGMTWNFVELGPRRTQEIRGGIMDTAPFHWDGDMNDLTHLTHDVMGERMSGPELPADYVQVLARWMDNLKFPAREVPADLASVERGREIFHSAQAACASCHSDDRMGADAAFDVGTGIVAHVPGLMGVSLRPPFMHTGCAQTMRDRFAPGCGGTSHGSVAHLDEQGLSDLIVYLESL